jgi:ABC-type antimicrobial peptide transport system permease subunit
MADFKVTVSDILPEWFIAHDSLDIALYVRHVLDRTTDSFMWLLVIIGVISVLFCALLLFHILKSRTYDIGVLMARGMSRIKMAFMLTSETLIVFMFAFAFAVALYFTLYAPISEFIYREQLNFINRDRSFYSSHYHIVFNAVLDYEFTASVYPSALIYGLIAVVVFTFIVGFAVTLFISRHEPMKIMTRY